MTKAVALILILLMVPLSVNAVTTYNPNAGTGGGGVTGTCPYGSVVQNISGVLECIDLQYVSNFTSYDIGVGNEVGVYRNNELLLGNYYGYTRVGGASSNTQIYGGTGMSLTTGTGNFDLNVNGGWLNINANGMPIDILGGSIDIRGVEQDMDFTMIANAADKDFRFNNGDVVVEHNVSAQYYTGNGSLLTSVCLADGTNCQPTSVPGGSLNSLQFNNGSDFGGFGEIATGTNTAILYIADNSPEYYLTGAATGFEFTGTDSAAQAVLVSDATGSGSYPAYMALRSRAGHTTVGVGDILMSLESYGYRGGWLDAGAIQNTVAGIWSGISQRPTQWEFSVVPPGSSSQVVAMTLNANKSLQVVENVSAKFYRGNGSLLTSVCLTNGSQCPDFATNSRLTALNNSKLNLTDQRYNETAFIQSLNASVYRLNQNAPQRLFVNNTNVTLTAPTEVHVDFGTANKVQWLTDGKKMVIGETGDYYGTSTIELASRSGLNGALFKAWGIDVVDFALQSSSGGQRQKNIRNENRFGRMSVNTDGEISILFDPTNLGAGFSEPVNIGRFGTSFYGADISEGRPGGQVAINLLEPTATFEVQSLTQQIGNTEYPGSTQFSTAVSPLIAGSISFAYYGRGGFDDGGGYLQDSSSTWYETIGTTTFYTMRPNLIPGTIYGSINSGADGYYDDGFGGLWSAGGMTQIGAVDYSSGILDTANFAWDTLDDVNYQTTAIYIGTVDYNTGAVDTTAFFGNTIDEISYNYNIELDAAKFNGNVKIVDDTGIGDNDFSAAQGYMFEDNIGQRFITQSWTDSSYGHGRFMQTNYIGGYADSSGAPGIAVNNYYDGDTQQRVQYHGVQINGGEVTNVFLGDNGYSTSFQANSLAVRGGYLNAPDTNVFSFSSVVNGNNYVGAVGNGKLGIGTANPQAKLHIWTNSEQMRVGWDANNFFNMTAKNGGQVVLNANGTNQSFLFLDNVTIGNATGSVTIDSRNSVRFIGNATFFDDMTVPLLTSRIGATAPSFDESEKSLKFTNANPEEYTFFSMQLPHGYKEGSDIGCHLHIRPDGTAKLNTTFELNYTWFNINEVSPASSLITKSVNFTSGVAYNNTILDFGQINGTGKRISSSFLAKVTRKSQAASDTYAGAVFVDFADCHVERDSLGSNEEYIK